jgi:hypothetical protein
MAGIGGWRSRREKRERICENERLNDSLLGK